MKVIDPTPIDTAVHRAAAEEHLRLGLATNERDARLTVQRIARAFLRDLR